MSRTFLTYLTRMSHASRVYLACVCGQGPLSECCASTTVLDGAFHMARTCVAVCDVTVQDSLSEPCASIKRSSRRSLPCCSVNPETTCTPSSLYWRTQHISNTLNHLLNSQNFHSSILHTQTLLWCCRHTGTSFTPVILDSSLHWYSLADAFHKARSCISYGALMYFILLALYVLWLAHF